ncbi:uncharacterized protein RAG0_02778 [Rhynchosporium agropyri]|uniref:Uncharacterized protein n=1 Tax=Rhynchosporium agropyri TaxID=914238 RepID=A0A1E1K2L6_9HELO|nr:uncharacterized protein RAG0_02778 [Rhynchosporium agropyri]
MPNDFLQNFLSSSEICSRASNLPASLNMDPTELTPQGIPITHQLPATPPCSPRSSTSEQCTISSQAKRSRLLQSTQGPTKMCSRCALSLDEEHRLENLSWRLRNTETFCSDPFLEDTTTIRSIFISASSQGVYSAEPLSLSGSLESLVYEEALELGSDNTPTSVFAPVGTSHSRIQRQQNSVPSRSHGRERHVTPDYSEKIIITIKEKKDPKPLFPRDQSHLATLVKGSTQSSSLIQTPAPANNSKSITSENSTNHSAWLVPSDSAHGNTSRTIVVRGFCLYAFSDPSKSLATANSIDRLMLAVGAASGDGATNEQTDPVWNSLRRPAPQLKKREARLSFGISSNEDENPLSQSRSALVDPRQQAPKKQTSLKKDQLTVKEEQAISSDTFEKAEGETDESAIDDDDDPSHWEDLVEDSIDSRTDDEPFQRVNPRSNLTSRQSLITLLYRDQLCNTNALANTAAATKPALALQRFVRSSPNGPSLAVSPESEDNLPLVMKDSLKSVSEVPRSQPQLITLTQGLPLSPRSTRRNMLASEMTGSLRQHLLWVQKQTSQNATAICNRRQAAKDAANLKQIPEKFYIDQSDGDSSHWKDYYGRDLGGDHSKGW